MPSTLPTQAQVLREIVDGDHHTLPSRDPFEEASVVIVQLLKKEFRDPSSKLGSVLIKAATRACKGLGAPKDIEKHAKWRGRRNAVAKRLLDILLDDISAGCPEGCNYLLWNEARTDPSYNPPSKK